jgi:hypothetical protein
VRKVSSAQRTTRKECKRPRSSYVNSENQSRITDYTTDKALTEDKIALRALRAPKHGTMRPAAALQQHSNLGFELGPIGVPQHSLRALEWWPVPPKSNAYELSRALSQ